MPWRETSGHSGFADLCYRYRVVNPTASFFLLRLRVDGANLGHIGEQEGKLPVPVISTDSARHNLSLVLFFAVGLYESAGEVYGSFHAKGVMVWGHP